MSSVLNRTHSVWSERYSLVVSVVCAFSDSKLIRPLSETLRRKTTLLSSAREVPNFIVNQSVVVALFITFLRLPRRRNWRFRKYARNGYSYAETLI